MKKRIAAFSTDWNFEISYRVHQGMEQFLHDNPDYTIYAFDCFARFGNTMADLGENQIFCLPDFSAFDGVVIQANQILDDRVRLGIVDGAKKAGKPVISINYRIDGIPYIETDNYSAMRELADHVIEVHHARRLAFLTGYSASTEAEERKRAFLDSCRAHHIPEDQITVINGRWEYAHGKAAAESLLTDPENLPDVLMCANDDMAIGAMETFLAAGIRIPEDIMVTGFDNIGDAMAFQPRLTTISRNYEGMGYRACRMIRDITEGRVTGEDTADNYRAVFAGSCGCSCSYRDDEERIRKRFFRVSRLMKNYSMAQEDLVSELLDAGDFGTLLDTFEKNAAMFGTRKVLIMRNGDASVLRGNQGEPRITVYVDRMSLMAEYSADGVKEACGKYHCYSVFDTREMLPERYVSPGQIYMFYPLHFREICLGYMVTEGIPPASEYNLLEGTLRFMEESYENLRKKYLLKSLNEKLDRLYVRDPLTGLYNRFGYDRYARGMADKIRSDGGAPGVFFCDMDDMKSINDNYGHENGDRAIIAAADLLVSVFGQEKSFVMRYGGDEFMAICDVSGEDYTARIDKAVDDLNASGRLPFSIGISTGVIRIREGMSIDACVSEADQIMYARKNEKKAQRKK